MALVGGAGIPAGAVSTRELHERPNFEERGIMQVMQHPILQAVQMPAWPVRIDGKPPNIQASPVLGEHTENVLKSWLGLSEADVKSLHGDGIL